MCIYILRTVTNEFNNNLSFYVTYYLTLASSHLLALKFTHHEYIALEGTNANVV